jgi:hypothetical protein
MYKVHIVPCLLLLPQPTGEAFPQPRFSIIFPMISLALAPLITQQLEVSELGCNILSAPLSTKAMVSVNNKT